MRNNDQKDTTGDARKERQQLIGQICSLSYVARLKRAFSIHAKNWIRRTRYHRDGYIFLRDALDFTTKQQKKVKGVSVRHVTGPELLDGVRQYALKEFGPMVMTVFDNWGIHSSEDVGHMVFNLIGAGIFGKTEQDSIEDFKNVYDFEEAFVRPFAPEKPKSAKPPAQLPASKPATSSK